MENIFNEAAFGLGLALSKTYGDDGSFNESISPVNTVSNSSFQGSKENTNPALLSAYVYTSHIRYFIF